MKIPEEKFGVYKAYKWEYPKLGKGGRPAKVFKGWKIMYFATSSSVGKSLGVFKTKKAVFRRLKKIVRF